MSFHSDLSNNDSLDDFKSAKNYPDGLSTNPNLSQMSYFVPSQTISSSSSSYLSVVKRRGRPPKRVLESSQSLEKIEEHDAKMYESLRSDLFEKLEIIKNQPVVQMSHAKPVRVLVIDQNTKKVSTNALLFISYYKSYSSKCVWCPLCKVIMDVSQFLKHIETHMEFNNEQNIESNGMKKPKKIYNMQLCDSEKENDYSIKNWKIFKRNFSKFKAEHDIARKKVKILMNEDEAGNSQANSKIYRKSSYFIEGSSRVNFQDQNFTYNEPKLPEFPISKYKSYVKNLSGDQLDQLKEPNSQDKNEKQDLRFFR